MSSFIARSPNTYNKNAEVEADARWVYSYRTTGAPGKQIPAALIESWLGKF